MLKRGGTTAVRISRDLPVPLAKQFADGIRSAIRRGVYRRGDKLPTIGEWTRLLGVSESVPRRGLALLAKDCVISVKRHVGAVVIGAESRRIRGRVLYVTIDCGGVYGRNVVAFWLGRELAKAGYRFEHVSIPPVPSGSADYLRLKDAIRDGVDFVVFDGERRRGEVLALLDEYRIPYAVEKSFVEGLAAAEGGPSFAETLVEKIRSSGVRRVIHVGFGLWFGDAITAGLSSRNMLVERMKLPMPTYRGCVDEFQRSAMVEFAKRLAKGRRWLPDLFVFSDDFVATGALLSLSAYGVRVPEDVRVITLSNKGLGPVYLKPLTRFEIDNKQYGIRLGRYVLARLSGGASVLPAIRPVYIAGKTF